MWHGCLAAVSLGWLCDPTIATLLARLEREPEERLVCGVPFPTAP
jgi:hypothetical protein